MKKIIFFLILMSSIFGGSEVYAGTLTWKESTRIDSTHFEFYIEAVDLDINYLSTQISIDNGKLISVTPYDGWLLTQNGQNQIQFQHDGPVAGNFRIARALVEMTGGTANYTLKQVQTKKYLCEATNTIIFGSTGNFVTEDVYRNQCFDGDAYLSSLIVNHGALSPTFNESILEYNLTVEHEVSDISFVAIPRSNKAKITSGTNCSLNVGDNSCSIVVEAENGTKIAYVIHVIRKAETVLDHPKSNDATLSNLIVSHGTLNPNFQKNVKQYTLTVENNVSMLTFNPKLSHSKARISSGTTCALNEGLNFCDIIVIAEDGTTNTYSIQVTKKRATDPINPSLSGDTSIASLTPLLGTLSPSFQPNHFAYTITLDKKVDSFAITYFVNYEKDNPDYHGHNYLCLVDEKKQCNIVVTAEDGTTTKTYQFDIQFLNEEDSNISIMDEIKQSYDEIENPQTGEVLKPSFFLLSFLGITFAIIFLLKKNSIHKI